MDASERIKFEPVVAAGQHLHCYLDVFYVARISVYADHCGVDGPGFAPCQVPSEEEAREVGCGAWNAQRGQECRRSAERVTSQCARLKAEPICGRCTYVSVIACRHPMRD